MNKETEELLQLLANENFEDIRGYFELNSKHTSGKYEIIFDALIAVAKIGDGTLESGLERLHQDYSENIAAEDYHGWGKNPQGNPGMLIGEKRAIVNFVIDENSKHKNLLETCDAISELFDITYDKFKNYQADIRNSDSDNILKDELDFIDSLKNKGFYDLSSRDQILIEHIEKNRV